MKPKHQRLIFILVSVLFLCAAALMVMQAFKKNIVFFMSPSDVALSQALPTGTVRIGGLVEAGSIKRADNDQLSFVVHDGAHKLTVHYKGLLPNLFREGQGVVTEGVLRSKSEFDAKNVLAKHDENYMPKEVVDALKKSGRWQEGEKNER